MGKEPLWESQAMEGTLDGKNHNTQDTNYGCEDCGQTHMGDCPVRGPILRIRDKHLPSRARLTLPQYLVLKEVEVKTGNQQVLGVFARKLIQQRTQFGPFVAPRVPYKTEPDPHRLLYKIFDKDGKEKASLDINDESNCSWMMFVRAASSYSEQNIVAYQFNEDVYFSTCKPITPHTELKVWYASDYAKLLNTHILGRQDEQMTNLSIPSPPFKHEQAADSFFTTLNSRQEHGEASTSYQCSDNNNNSSPSAEPWKCSNCSEVFSTFAQLESHPCENKRAKRGRKPKLKLGDNHNSFAATAAPTAEGLIVASNHGGKEEDTPAIKLEKESKTGKPRRGRAKKEPKTYSCAECPKVFVNAEKLKTHTYMHTGERPFVCSHTGCVKAFISKYKLLRHMATHSPNKMHSCTYCNKKFHRKDHLKNHLQTHDPNKEAFRCGECGKVYSTKPGYKKHLALHAAASGELVCKLCEKDFESTETLLQHLKLHSGKSTGVKEKKHQCEHCDRRFYTRKDVRRHMVVHTGRKDFLCQTCGQRFGRKDHLVRHTRKSHKEDDMELRVRLGEQLQAVGVTTVQHMLGMQHLQEQQHHQLQHPHHLQQHAHHQQQQLSHHHHHQQMSPMAPQHQQQFMHPMQQAVPQLQSAATLPPPPCTMSQPQQFTELLKIPPVPRFKSQIPPKVTIKNEVHKMNDPMDIGGLDTCSVGRGQMMQDTLGPGGVDLGQLLGFLPLNNMQQQPLAPAAPPTPTSPPMSLPPNTPPATLPQSPLNIPQTQLPQPGMHTPDQTGVLNPAPMDNHMNHLQMQHMGPTQVPFSGMHSLPRFHQAFQ
ncbi:uncharacterized protein [Diadema setosum]|uniref:uncharacterized protein isoform X2 n=1 Tax=Diadema setosum TaxID=31175 RepID=UPI003B3BBF20